MTESRTDSYAAELASVQLFTVIPEFPYNEYTTGYVYERRDVQNRKYIQFYKYGVRMTGTTYARYLISVHLGRRLEDDVEVDHINNDPADDRLDNYQLLAPAQNQLKRNAFVGEKCAVLLCPTCQQKIVMPMNRTHFNRGQGTLVSFCSSRCAGKFNGSNLTRDDARHIGKHQALYAIRTHWFEYEPYFHGYYPYTEIQHFLSRALLSEDCSRCRDIPGLTEYCWDIFTPSTEREAQIIALAEQGLSLREMERQLHMDRKLIANFLKQTRPDLVKTPKTEEILPLVKASLAAGRNDEDIAVEVGFTTQQLYNFIRYHKLITPGRKTTTQKLVDEKILRVREYVKLGLSNAEMARRENIGQTSMHYFKTRWKEMIEKEEGT